MATYGYKGEEYEFVGTTKEFLDELKCPICFDLASDPVKTSCNHLFCGECIEGIQQCPLDRGLFTTTPDRFTDRRVHNLKVKCPNNRRGCRWQGNLGNVNVHTNADCDYQFVVCLNEGCNVEIESRHLLDHVQYECPERMYNCPFCTREDTYLEVTTRHFTECEDMPLPCPSGCGRCGLVRRNMAHHLSEDCPEELVPCTYAIAGCQQIVKRKDLQQHLQDKDKHLDTVFSSYLFLTFLVQDSLHGSTPDIPLPLRPWLQNTPTCYPRPHWVIKMEGFEEKKENDEVWYSDPVHSHFGGYKMCLRVYANGAGDVTNVSVHVFLMRGDNDDNLKWPFKGTIKVSLLNQLEDGQHLTKELWSPDSDVCESSSERVTERERADTGHGLSQFISHDGLNYPGYRNCQYLKDNTLFFRVDCFEPKFD